MRVIVTGGAGFIGSSLARELVARGEDVVVFDDLSSGSRDSVPSGAELVQGDIRDEQALEKVMPGADVVFHQAALRSVPRSLDEPSVVHEVNATGTLNILIAAEKAGVRRVVYASSSSVYGGAMEGMSREDMTPNPLSPYAVSKLTGEYYCTVWARLGRIETVSLRYFNVFGPGQTAESKYAAVFPAFVSALVGGRSPTIHWDGEQSRDFTYIGDVVAANVLSMDASAPAGPVLNIAGGKPRTINEVFQTISDVLDVTVEPTRTPKREGDIRHSFADRARALEVLRWEPQAGWEDAVRATVKWFKEG